MYRRLFAILIFLCCSSYSVNCFAFDSPSISYLGIEQGLSNNAVTTIYQDHNGFMWFGTYDGLNRYDGYTFKIFRNIIGDSTSLSNNHIYTIDGDASHNIWIGCEKGLNVYNPVLSRFTVPKYKLWNSSSLQTLEGGVPVVRRINDFMMVGSDTRGILVFEKNKTTGVQIPVSFLRGREGDYTVNAIEYDPFRKLVWVLVSQAGLCQFDLKTKSLKLIDSTIKQANCLKVDHYGNLWLGNDNGLFRYDFKTRAFSENLMPIRYKISSLFEDRQNIFWIGSDGGGVWYSPTSLDKPSPYSPESKSAVNSNAVYSIYGDKEGRKWIGTLRGGVNVIHPHTSSFKYITYNVPGQNNVVNNFILSFCEDKTGNVWIGTDGAGLRYWNQNKSAYTQYLHQPSNPGSISSNFVTRILRDDQNDLWISTWFGGINRLKNGSQTFEHFTCFNTTINTVESNAWLVYEDAQKRIWASTTNNGTLYIFNRRNNRFELFDPQIQNIQCLAEDSQGNLWGGNYTSLISIDRIGKNHRVYKVGYTVRSIHEDVKKNLWVGTEGGGLLLFNRTDGSFRRFTTAEGLPSNTVLCMLEDRHNNLWFSTYNGLCKFNIDTKVCRNFSHSDGLQSNQFSFNAALAMKTGEFLFGGIKGFNRFHPDSVSNKAEIPPSFLTGLRVNNIPIEDDDSYVTERSFEKITELTLPFEKGVLSLDFIALEYTGSDKIQYAYFLDGWDKSWNYVNNLHTANYSRLQEGEYTFKLKVTNSDGIWGGETRLLKIIVLPPWYRTWWAYLFYVLFLGTCVYLYVLYNKRQERLKYQMQLARLEKEKEKEITEKKLSFFTHIAHEFGTPLTLIINPVKDLLEKSENQEGKNELNIVYRNARRLRNLVDQLLIFRRADVEADKMNFSRVNFYNFCYEVFLCFVQQTKMNHQEYLFVAENKDLELFIDREKMEIALYNLISNAVKYTPQGGKIVFRISENENEVNVLVSDTGYGIPKEAASRLFEKFYQAENIPVKSGFGIGLYLVRHFVEGHKGEITFESEEGAGTNFKIQLKKGTAHLDQKNILTDQSLLNDKSEEHIYNPEDEEIPIQASQENSLEELVVDRQTVLVVDDDQAIRKYLFQILKEKYNVIEAVNGKEAFDLARQQYPDLVISDIQMDEMDGIELCKRIKKEQSLNHIPVILLTGSFGVNTELRSVEGGADVYITKPFEKDILLAKVDNIFQSRSKLQDYFFNEITLKKNTLKISAEYKDFLEKCIAIVEENIDSDDFSIKDLAREIGMSHSNLYKKVKLISGQSITGFVRFIRLRKAAELLIKTDCNINQAAFQVGINDIKYFRVQFNKLFGMNPSDYCRKYRRPSLNKEYHLSSQLVKNKKE